MAKLFPLSVVMKILKYWDYVLLLDLTFMSAASSFLITLL